MNRAAREQLSDDRSSWPVRKFRLGDEPSEDLSQQTTPEERLAMMWPLAMRAWLLADGSLADYDRASLPGRLIRPAR